MNDRTFRGLFGIVPVVCSMVWDKIYQDIDSSAEPKHFLWSLVFLKVYSTETVHSSLFGTNPKTYRKWSWYFIDKISNLQIVSLN